MDAVYFSKLCDIPILGDGYSLVARSAANDGSLLFLYAGAIVLQEPVRFRLCVMSETGAARTIDLPELDVTFPHVDMFPDGKVLVAGARCSWRGDGDFDLNGIVFDPGTGHVSRILLGDGINSVQVDALGRIWVAYSDEGIFGNFGWGDPGPAPIGAAGLACFSERGEKIWDYPANAEHMISDCPVRPPPYASIRIFMSARYRVSLSSPAG